MIPDLETIKELAIWLLVVAAVLWGLGTIIGMGGGPPDHRLDE